MPLFQDNYICLTFTSETGCNISVLFTQTESRANKIKDELIQLKKNHDKRQEEKLNTYLYDKDLDSYHNEMLQMIENEKELSAEFEKKAKENP